MQLGVAEALVALAAAVVVVGAITGLVIAAGRNGARANAGPVVPTGFTPSVPAGLQDRVRAHWARNQKIAAIKLIRQETGLGLKEAKAVAEHIGDGRGLPDLASRVRELKATGRTEQAIFLVCGETGMTPADAQTFVNTL